jgi:perosamine synthetase
MLKLSQPNISEEAIAAVVDVLRSGQLVHGSESEAFERELAAYLGWEDVILVSSGTAALHVALLALGIGQGDAVIVPDFTFPATANAVVMVGARPVIVDVEPHNYNLNPEAMEAAIMRWQGPECLRAVMPVHEFGCPADMVAISRIANSYGLAVIEDAACALGALCGDRKVGTMGDLGCFSFHPRKTLTTGEGGAIATHDRELAQVMRRLRNHGMERSASGMHFLHASTNYRLTNFQAALGRIQLPQLNGWIESRRTLVRCYLDGLVPLAAKGLLTFPEWNDGHSWQTFMVVLDNRFDRNKVIAEMWDQGIETSLGAQSLSTLGLYGDQDQLVVGPDLFISGLALPMFEQMNLKDVEHVCAGLATTLGA